MAWTIFILGGCLVFDGLVATTETIKGYLCICLWVVIGSIMMFSAMYLRHLGW